MPEFLEGKQVSESSAVTDAELMFYRPGKICESSVGAVGV